MCFFHKEREKTTSTMEMLLRDRERFLEYAKRKKIPIAEIGNEIKMKPFEAKTIFVRLRKCSRIARCIS